jgi:hypothetical protein
VRLSHYLSSREETNKPLKKSVGGMGGKNNRIQQNASVGLFQIVCRYIHKKPDKIKPEETNTGKKPTNPKNKKARREYNKMPEGNAAASIQLLTKKKKRQTQHNQE